MKSLFKKVFSITQSEDGLHNKLVLFGIKIYFARPSIEMKRRKHPYYYYKKHNLDITTMPPATGDFREFQLATLALLIDFDEICKQNNIHYWLDFGTLIGAVRHKGYIPWDDDIDLGLFREDFDRIMDVVNNNTVNPDIIADVVEGESFIKIKNKKTDLLFLDLFPVDEYGEIIPEEQQLEESVTIRKLAQETKLYLKSEKDFNKRQARLNEIKVEKVVKSLKPNDKTKMQYVWGIDFAHCWRNWFTNYDVYFPFKTITFEGLEFPCMNKPEEYLARVYGNFMGYPRKMRLGHNILKEHSKEDKAVFRELIREKGLEDKLN